MQELEEQECWSIQVSTGAAVGRIRLVDVCPQEHAGSGGVKGGARDVHRGHKRDAVASGRGIGRRALLWLRKPAGSVQGAPAVTFCVRSRLPLCCARILHVRAVLVLRAPLARHHSCAACMCRCAAPRRRTRRRLRRR
jgi:hypothetical protein